MNSSEKRNSALFVALCAVCVLAIVLFSVFSKRRSEQRTAQQQPQQSVPASRSPSAGTERPVAPTAPRSTGPSATVSQNHTGPRSALLYFRANALGNNYGKLAVASLSKLSHPSYSSELSCERVYFAESAGVCLTADRGMFTSFYAVTFDEQLHKRKALVLNGEPSRVRISPDGRLAAITVFLSGHSYSSLAFSTQTTLVDVNTAKTLCDLGQFSVMRDGVPFKQPDFNFWGVTFTHDGKHFYATLWSSGRTYLIKGDIPRRSAQVIFNDVECPSLSPDNTQIAFKKKIGAGQPGWHIHLLTLASLTERDLGETRNVDDQVEWLDNGHVLYSLSENPNGASASTDIWELSTKAGATPRLFLKGAFSPAVSIAQQSSHPPTA